MMNKQLKQNKLKGQKECNVLNSNLFLNNFYFNYMPIEIKVNKRMGKNLFVDNISRKTEYVDIYGIEKPKIIIREGQPFTVVKETKNKDDNKNIGVILKKNYVEIANDLTSRIKQLGGNNDYYYKYLKYKQKYNQLKADLLLRNR